MLMCSNWASRSGWEGFTVRVFLSACSPYPSIFSIRPTVSLLAWWPCSLRVWASLRRLLLVHSSGRMGSPLVWACSSSLRVWSIWGFSSQIGLRPPPVLRHLPCFGICVFGLFISFMPFVSVWREVPVSWFMRVIPPWPSVFASIERYLLFWYSFSVGSIVSMRVFSAFMSGGLFMFFNAAHYLINVHVIFRHFLSVSYEFICEMSKLRLG